MSELQCKTVLLMKTATGILFVQVKDLPSPYGVCNDSPNYIQSVCEANCLADYIIKQCGCKDIYMRGN
jgi:Amiloride-sensitive sodium channel